MFRVPKFLPALTRGIFTLCCLLLLMQLYALQTVEANEPRYGTFLQLNDTNKTWSPAQWKDVFDHFQNMGFRDIVVQWSTSDRNSFELLLQQLLDNAAQRDMKVWIGLRNDSNWWKSIAMPTRFVEIYLWKLMNTQVAIADRLISKYGLHKAFSGIYLPIEIDDSTWLAQDKLFALKGVLYQFSQRITVEHPGINIAMSGFSEGFATPEQVATLWYSLISAGNLTRVYFRDSVGVRMLEPEKSVQYFKAIQGNLPAGKTTLVAVLEPFTQTSVESIRTGAFTAQTAPIDRVLRQVDLTRAAGLQNISFYSALEFMNNSGSAEAQALGRAWMRSFRQRDVKSIQNDDTVKSLEDTHVPKDTETKNAEPPSA